MGDRMKNVRVVYMGTPEFSLKPLEVLIDKMNVVGVVTKPDAYVGRKKVLTKSPVRLLAEEHNIPVLAPQSIKTDYQSIIDLEPDMIVTCAYGKIIPKALIDYPKFGCINIHASLLPKYRGAAPIQWAILEGEQQTGITIMQMNEGLDTGDMLTKCVVDIEPKETGETLFHKMADSGAKLLLETLPLLEEGKLKPEKQKEEDSTYAPMIKKEMGKIQWNKDAETLERLVRGMNSWPSAYTFLEKKTLKIWDADVEEKNSQLPAGTVTEVTKDSLKVQTGDGLLVLKSLQLEGKKRMEVKAFLLGNKIEPGTSLG